MLLDPPQAAPAPAATLQRTSAPEPPPTRLLSLDAYRGFVMLLMISAGLGIAKVAKSFPQSGAWQFWAHQTEHAEWRGCTLWDLIQPSFMFIVGVAVPWSLAARRAKGGAFWGLGAHALWRALR